MTIVSGAAAAALWTWWLPRGPQTGPEAVVSVALAVALGAWHGALLRSRPALWLPATACAAVAVRESLRAPLGLASTELRAEALRGSSYALGALLLGRGVDLALAGVPWLLGVLARRSRSRLPRVVTALVMLLALGLLFPASTPSAGPDRLAEVATLDVGGCTQRVVVRGRAGGPVVVFFSGGPGGTEVGTLARQWAGIEADATLVVWDQTGAGLNATCFPRDARLTLPRLRADAAAVLAWTKARFGRAPVLVGNSWGTLLGALVAGDHPELVRAYVGTGQMVDLRATDRLFYADTLRWAESAGRADVEARLRAQGPPPYPSIYPYEEVFAHEGDWNRWDRDPGVAAAVNPLANVMPRPELDPVAKLRYAGNIVDSFDALYPTVQDVDLRRDLPSLRVPVYLAQGVHEARGRQELARTWFDGLTAPHKEWVAFERSGHKAFGEQPEQFRALLRRVVAETAG